MSDDPTSLDALATEVSQLRDLFLRRLLEDRAKQQLYDRLYAELDFARSDLTRQFVAPLCREVLLVIDRIEAARTDGADPKAVLDSVLDELTEMMARRGVSPLTSVGSPFDPQVHEAVDRVAVDHADEDGRIVRERRRGYRMDTVLLRPAQVIVGHHDGAAAG
jgi:molecular chaperone GrpE